MTCILVEVRRPFSILYSISSVTVGNAIKCGTKIVRMQYKIEYSDYVMAKP